MQFPLDNLYRHVIDSINPYKKQQPILAGSPNMPVFTLKKVIVQAKLALFNNISAAASGKQLRILLYTVQVAMNDLQKTISDHKNQQQANSPSYELYNEVQEQLLALDHFLEHHFYDKVDIGIGASGQQSATPNAKLVTNLSVAQLALLLRLLVDTGIITGNDNTRQFIENIAGMVSTKRMTAISADSLRVKYYTPEIAAINILRDYLKNMLRLLQQYAE